MPLSAKEDAMVTFARFASALAVLAAGSVLVVPGCAVDMSEPEPGDEEAATEAQVDEASAELQANEFCCYADCAGDGKGWRLVGKPNYGECREDAASFCRARGFGYNGADWRPCP
jgi:hypothetical protein